MIKRFSFFALLLLPVLGFTQQAVLYGTVFDGRLNEPLPFATISIEDLAIGSTSELDGAWIDSNLVLVLVFTFR